MSNADKQKPVEWATCFSCGSEYAKWTQPMCRFCWKRKYHKNYIPTRAEVDKYCIIEKYEPKT